MTTVGWQLLYWNAEGCTSYVCHISHFKVHIYTFLYVGCYWLKGLFGNVWIKVLGYGPISQYLAAPFSHCKAMIDNMLHNSVPYFIWYAPLSLTSSSSSSVYLCTHPCILTPLLPLPLFYLCTLPCNPYSSSSSSSVLPLYHPCILTPLLLFLCFTSVPSMHPYSSSSSSSV